MSLTYHYFLGLRTLTVIKDAADMVYKNKGIKINLSELVENIDKYPDVYKMLQEGKTTGIFQFEAEAVTSLLSNIYADIKRLDYAETEEEREALGKEFFSRLSIANALNRPGPMAYIPEYLKNMNDTGSIVYDDPRLKPILEETSNIIVYQEQVQQICRALAGFSYGQADIIRKVIGKKQLDKVAEQRRYFIYGDKEKNILGCVNNGVSEELATEIWNKMEEFAKYAFNKSHSVSYTIVSFLTAYLKYYYPEEFMAALLTSVSNNTDKLKKYVNACSKKVGIQILPPDINKSMSTFTSDGDGSGIRFGFAGIKSVGKLSEEILAERDENGSFEGIYDFATRLSKRGLNKRNFEALIKSGAFDLTGYNRGELLDNLEMILSVSKNNSSGQKTLFDLIEDGDKYKYPEIKRGQDISDELKMKYENESIGLYISCHPLDNYVEIMEKCGCVSISDIRESVEEGLGNFKHKEKVNLGIIISKVNKRLTKKNDPMAILSIQDFDSESSAIAWSQALERGGDLFVEGERALLAKATIDIRDDGVSFFIDDLYALPDKESEYDDFMKRAGIKEKKKVLRRAPKEYTKKVYDERYAKGLYLEVHDMPQLIRLINILKKFPGESNVFFTQGDKIKTDKRLKVNIHMDELFKMLHVELPDEKIKIRK